MRKKLISMSIISTYSTFASVSCKKRSYLSGTVKLTIVGLGFVSIVHEVSDIC